MVDFDPKQINEGKSGSYTKEHWEALIKLVDERTLSPSQRAAKIYEIIQVFYDKKENPQWDWDVLCFCSELIVSLSRDIKFLDPIARQLNIKVYQYHYQLAYEIGLITFDSEENGKEKQGETGQQSTKTEDQRLNRSQNQE